MTSLVFGAGVQFAKRLGLPGGADHPAATHLPGREATCELLAKELF